MSKELPQRTITVSRMRDLPVGLRAKMRELSLGPIPWGFWSWTFQDGSCWAALCFVGGETTEDTLVGWAAVTFETDLLPVVGVYVSDAVRGHGIGQVLVSTLLQSMVNSGVLAVGDTVFCSMARWSKYDAVIRLCGLRPTLWV